jgi:eukaryotic-like serine/threonine-protein kinase
MTNADQHLMTLFAAALECGSDAERTAYLDRACADDHVVRDRLEALLRAHGGAGRFLEATSANIPTAAPAGPGAGAVLGGRFKLLEVIGEGGMGAVWLAEQTEPVKRLVALKVIKAGMDSKGVLARFEAERQALALMDHPNIAKVLDAGATPEGRPFFAMELVKGTPITRYCDEHRLTPRQRLELFVQVCQAVQHAHQKGVIHRDLKPSNVLVAPYDGRPVPKVIDFGVAKAAGQPLTDKTLVTGLGAVVGTPEYMSPEQAELNNADIDTRSDVYALGVLLYELLTGGPPFTNTDLEKAGMLEMLRAIREQEPARPSTKLSTTEGLPALAANRGTEPAKLTRLVRGELDWIVMKALEKDRTRRYETANGFAMDVQRYLADEPVQACPPSTWYRFRKLTRRNRAALATAATVLATIIIGLSASTFLIAQERDAARGASQRESEERERAEANLRSAREAVDRIYTLAAEKMADQPHMEQIRRALLEDALEFYQGFLKQKGTDPLIRHETARAYLRVGSIQSMLGRLDRTEDPLRQAIALLQRLVADYPTEPEYRSDLGDAYECLARYFGELAQPLDNLQYRLAALEIQRKLAADFPNRPEFRKALAKQLTSAAMHQSLSVQDTRTAEELFREAMELWHVLQQEYLDDADVAGWNAWAHWWLGVMYQATNRLPEAESEMRSGLALRDKLLKRSPNSPELLAMQAHNKAYLADVLMLTGRAHEAESLIRDNIAFQQRVIRDHPKYYGHWNRLVLEQAQLFECQMAMGQSREAEETIRECLNTTRKFVDEFPDASEREKLSRLGWVHYLMAFLLHDTGRPQEAAEAFLEAKRCYDQSVAKFPDPHAWRCPTHTLAWLLADCPATQLRDPARAAKLARDALRLVPQSGRYWLVLGVAQFRAGQAGDAIESLRKSMELLAGGDGRHWFILAMAHWQLGNQAEARKWYDQAVQWMETNQPRHEQQRRYKAEAAKLLGVNENE